MLPVPDVSGPTVGVYFEVYGVSSGEQLHFTLSTEAVKVDRSLLTRIGSLFRLGSSGGLPQRVTWTQAAELTAPTHLSHALTVGLGDLPEGDYQLVLRVQRENGEAAAASRLFRVPPHP